MVENPLGYRTIDFKDMPTRGFLTRGRMIVIVMLDMYVVRSEYIG